MDPGTQTAIGRAKASRSGPSSIKRVAEFARREFGPALTGSVLPFALVFYLALRGGGYDRVVLGEFGIAVWWLVLLGAVVGILPSARISGAGLVVLGLLSAFAVWTALGITWSESAERSAAEAARVAAYLGVFVLALSVQGRDGLRRTANAVAAAIALIGVLALVSRLHPAWFPANDAARLLEPDVGNRLSYPVNYWNGLAALLAMGIPLVLGVALNARHLAIRALAVAAMPAMVLAAFYTFSRGGVVAIALAVVAFLALYPRRLATIPTLLLAGGGSALLVAAATQRDALENHVLTDAARTQGDELLAIVLLVCAGVGLLQVAISLAARHRLGPRPTVSRRQGAGFAAGAVVLIVALAWATGLPGQLTDRWTDTDTVGAERLGSASTEGRGEYWSSALEANATAPLTGIGPGTFEYWWARNSVPGFNFIRDAHSLYMETLAELGIIGFTLIVLTIGAVLAAGLRGALTAHPERRSQLAGVVASCVAFAAFAGIDWVWEVPVLPVAFVLLAAALLGGWTASTAKTGEGGATGPNPFAPRPRRAVFRIGLAGLATLSSIVIGLPLASVEEVRSSEERLASGELDSALDAAERAESLQPYAATPKVQQAVVLERSGDLTGAAAAARDATSRESTNWRTWLLLANLEAERRQSTAALDAYDEAHRLNPRSLVFQETTREEFASRVGL
jgi:O-antigen ligase